MSRRIVSTPSHLFARLAVASVVASTVGCGGGDPASSLFISGVIDPAYGSLPGSQPQQMPQSDDPSLPIVVDTVVAMPHEKGFVGPHLYGSEIVVSAGPGDSFQLPVDPGRDYVVMLADTQSTEFPRIAGYVTMGAGDSSVVAIPMSQATSSVELSTVSPQGNEAQSQASLGELAAVFSLSESELAQVGLSDDAYKHLANAWVNWHPSTGTWYGFRGGFLFSSDFDSQAGIDPDSLGYEGVYLNIATNDPAVVNGFDGVCDDSLDVSLVPPGPVQADGISWDPSNPPSNQSGMTRWDQDACGDDTNLNAYRSAGEVVLQFGAGPVDAELEGLWRLMVGGQQVALFDLAVARPLRGDRPAGIVVTPQPVTGSDDTLERIDLAWQYWDGGWTTASPTLRERLLRSSYTGLTDYLGGSDPAPPGPEDGLLDTWTPADAWVFGAAQAGERSIYEVVAGYDLGGQSYRFAHRSSDHSACGDGVVSGAEACDGTDLGGATCESLGLFGPGVPTCLPDCTLDTSACNEGLTAERVSGDTLAFAPGAITANTVAWHIVNDGFEHEGVDLWASVVGVGAEPLPLAPEDDGVVHVGRLAFGDEAFVAFQVGMPAGPAEGKLVLSDGPPDATSPPSVIWEGPVLSWAVQSSAPAPSATVDEYETLDPGAPLGARQRVVVRGKTGTLAGDRRIDLHAAIDEGWKSAQTELESVSITAMVSGSTAGFCLEPTCEEPTVDVVTDRLVAWAPLGTPLDYEATLTFRVVGFEPTRALSAAITHDDGTGPAHAGSVAFGALPFSTNALSLVVTDAGGGVPLTPSSASTILLVDVVNPSAHMVVVDEVGFALPDHVTVTADVFWQDNDPTTTDFNHPAQIVDGQLVHRGKLRVPAGGMATFQAEVAVDGTAGLYAIDPWVRIGDTTIDVDQPVVVVLEGSGPCAAGEVQPFNNAPCSACPASTTSVAGMPALSSCFPCPADTYLEGVACLACPAGTISITGTVGAAGCMVPPAPPLVGAVSHTSVTGGLELAVTVADPGSSPVTSYLFHVEGPNGYQLTQPSTTSTYVWLTGSLAPGDYVISAAATNGDGLSSNAVTDPRVVTVN